MFWTFGDLGSASWGEIRFMLLTVMVSGIYFVAHMKEDESMTEIEKMKNGQWYDANFNQELQEMRLSAAKLYHAFNHAEPESDEQKNALRQLFHEDIKEGVPAKVKKGINQN